MPTFFKVHVMENMGQKTHKPCQTELIMRSRFEHTNCKRKRWQKNTETDRFFKDFSKNSRLVQLRTKLPLCATDTTQTVNNKEKEKANRVGAKSR